MTPGSTQGFKVYQAINNVQKALSKEGIAKDRVNTHQKYAFRGIDDVYNVLCGLLAECGLCILPRMLNRSCEERKSSSGTPIFYVVVEAEFDFISVEDGSKHVIKTFGEAMDSADKATNKAMSAAYKYAAFQAFSIPTEGNNDADETTPDAGQRVQRQAGQKPQQKKSTAPIDEMKSFVKVEDTLKPLADEILRIKTPIIFKEFVKNELPKCALRKEERRVIFGVCLKRAEELYLIYVPETQSWIDKDEAEGMGEAILNTHFNGDHQNDKRSQH